MATKRELETAADIALERRVAAYLISIDSPGLRNVRIFSRKKTVTLSGRVTTEYEKQVAKQCFKSVPGMINLVDNITVGIGPPPLIETWFLALKMFFAQIDRAFPFLKPVAMLVVLGVMITAGVHYIYPSIKERPTAYPAKGKILFDGKPIEGAKLILYLKSGDSPDADSQQSDEDAPQPKGIVDKLGNFTLSTYGHNDGAPAGEYIVTVEWFKVEIKDGEPVVGPNLIPVKYRSSKNSKLTVTITEGENQLPTLHILR